MLVRVIEFFAGEIKERRREERKHENAEKVVGRERSHQFGAEGEKIGAPGKSKNRRNPMRDAIGDLRVLQKIDDDSKQTKNASGGDQAAGIEGAGAGFTFILFLGRCFDQDADESAANHSASPPEGNIPAS